MLSRLTGGLRPWELSLEGRLHDTQPPTSVGVEAAQFGQGGRPLVEPGAFFVDGSYGLRINSWNSLAGVTVTVRLRFLNSDGRVVNHEYTHTPNTNRSKATSDFPLGVGFPLNMTAFASGGAPQSGQTFVQVQLVSGVGGATTLLGTLLQDYVTAVQALAWPGSPIRSSTEGNPFVNFVTGTNPGAGVELSETVPAGARWELISFCAELVNAANVGNRIAFLNLNGTVSTSFMSVQPAASVPAATTGIYRWAAGVSEFAPAVANILMQPLPIGLRLAAGQIISTTTNGMFAGDDWGAPRYIVNEWLDV